MKTFKGRFIRLKEIMEHFMSRGRPRCRGVTVVFNISSKLGVSGWYMSVDQ